ncbi:DUF1127 domain-containing protein [Ruegeria conchae]|uniref:Uncharacterized protein DUF1127 n=1 Tax=Ruegeria conchae TaxID=981384 RepID=A0A497Z989_9RHOB|nr:DUF1127 domain-containing protein [Ruegeria conchae]RLJ99806.1 uncharacterized protein DUF1127 [Ruegeria conchae]
MLDSNPNPKQNVSNSALLLFDQAMRMRAIQADIVRAGQELNRLSDFELSELGLNRCDVEAVIAQYI